MFRKTSLEADLLSDARWLLDLLTRLQMLAYTRIHVMPIIRGSGRFSKNFDMQGFSDLEIVVPGGRVGYLELKSKDGKLSDEQTAFIESRERMGCPCGVPRSLDDVIQFLTQKLGVPVDGVLKGLKAGGIDRSGGDSADQGVSGVHQTDRPKKGRRTSNPRSSVTSDAGRNENDDQGSGDRGKPHRKSHRTGQGNDSGD